MNNSIKQTQLVLLMIVVISGGKFLSLPGLTAHLAGRDSWISMAVMFAVDLVCLCFMLWAIRLNKGGKGFDEILSATLSPVVAKIIFLMYAVFFILRIMGGLLDTMELISSTLSVVTNWVGFIVPVMLVIGFSVLKGARNLGRVNQIFFGFILASVILILLLSFKNADLGNLQPYLADGWGVPLGGALNTSFWFADCIFIVFLMGSLTKNKLFNVKVAGSFLFGAVITVMLDVLFLALFGNTAQYGTSALAKVSGFNITGAIYGRLDWVFVVIWLSSIIIKCILFLWAATMSLSYVFGVRTQKGATVIFAVIGVIFVITPLVIPVKEFIYNVFCIGAGKYFTAVVQYLVPLVLPLLTWLANKKQPQAEQKAEDGQTEEKGQTAVCFEEAEPQNKGKAVCKIKGIWKKIKTKVKKAN